MPTRESVAAWLDRSRERWESAATSRPELAQGWEVVQTLRPAWWVLRAWVAVQVLDLATGPWEHATLVPRFGDDLSGLLLLLGAVVGSVLLGLRKAWPASQSPRSVLTRVVLLGLNALAVLLLVHVVDSFPSSSYLNEMDHPAASKMYRPFTQPGLRSDGRAVRNVFAYDAQGQPLEGVQLFDQTGKPLAIDPHSVHRVRYGGRLPVVFSWKNGERDVWNVYPLPVRSGGGWARDDRAWTSDSPPFLPQPPLAAVPPATLPLPPSTAPEADVGAEPSPADPQPQDQPPSKPKP